MADNPTLTRPLDAKRINVHQDHEFRYWTDKLGVSAEALRSAVEQVGPMVDDVVEFIGAEKRTH